MRWGIWGHPDTARDNSARAGYAPAVATYEPSQPELLCWIADGDRRGCVYNGPQLDKLRADGFVSDEEKTSAPPIRWLTDRGREMLPYARKIVAMDGLSLCAEMAALIAEDDG